jgi:hypothetical protein
MEAGRGSIIWWRVWAFRSPPCFSAACCVVLYIDVRREGSHPILDCIVRSTEIYVAHSPILNRLIQSQHLKHKHACRFSTRLLESLYTLWYCIASTSLTRAATTCSLLCGQGKWRESAKDYLHAWRTCIMLFMRSMGFFFAYMYDKRTVMHATSATYIQGRRCDGATTFMHAGNLDKALGDDVPLNKAKNAINFVLGRQKTCTVCPFVFLCMRSSFITIRTHRAFHYCDVQTRTWPPRLHVSFFCIPSTSICNHAYLILVLWPRYNAKTARWSMPQRIFIPWFFLFAFESSKSSFIYSSVRIVHSSYSFVFCTFNLMCRLLLGDHVDATQELYGATTHRESLIFLWYIAIRWHPQALGR